MHTNENLRPAAEVRRDHLHISKQIVDEVKASASNRWSWILERLGIAQELLTGRHCACPKCGGTDRFRFDNKNGTGTFICNHCGAGDGWTLLQLVHGWSFPEAIKRVHGALGGVQSLPVVSSSPREEFSAQTPDARAVNAIIRIWRESIAVERGDPVWKYLVETRRLRLQSIPSDLRHHPNCRTRLDDGTWFDAPAMVAAFRNPLGDLIQIHRTFLTADGLKAGISKPKRLMKSPYGGITKGGAIKLFEPSEILGVGEGIESSLACHVAWKIPTWSAFSADCMTSLVVPQAARHVVIAADHDASGKGEEAARRLAERMILEGRTVQIMLPIAEGADLADIVAQQGV